MRWSYSIGVSRVVLAWCLAYVLVCLYFFVHQWHELVDDLRPLAASFILVNWLWLGLVAVELGFAWRARRELPRVRVAMPAAALVLLAAVQVLAHEQERLGARIQVDDQTFSERIVYVEPWDDNDARRAPPRIRRAAVNRLGSRARFEDGEWSRRGGVLSIVDPRSGVGYFMARASANGRDAVCFRRRVMIDESVRVEYWTELRKQPERIAETSYDPEWSPHTSRGR